jgi:hypothetical protein
MRERQVTSREPSASDRPYLRPMDIPDRDALRRFTREHHVHYEVEPEEAAAEGRREVTGFGVRLFATHGDSKLEAPQCPRCVALREELRSFALRLIAGADGDRAELVPATASKIYRSTEVPGADEVAVRLHVRCTAPEHRAPEGGEDRCLGAVRERLEALGVPRR